MINYFVYGLTAAALNLAGCTTGKEIKRSDLDTLAVGKTSYSQVVKKFGPPRTEMESDDVCGLGKAGKLISYDYTSVLNNKSQVVMMKFNSHDKLCSRPMATRSKPL